MTSELSACCHPWLPKRLSEMNIILGPPELGWSCHETEISRELPSASHIGRAGPAMRTACVEGLAPLS